MKKAKKLISALLIVAIGISAFPSLTAISYAASWDELSNPVIDASTHVDGSALHVTEYSYVYFGTYPQSLVSGGALTQSIIDADYDSNGDAVVDGVKYKRLSKDMATEARETDGYFIWGDEPYYYFKYEPIKWRVLEIEAGSAFLVAENVLDTQKFRASGGTSERWETSTIRAWLNANAEYLAQGKNFINTAFNTRQTSYILTTYLENETQWTVSSGNDTQDKIFLLSYAELGMEKYGHCLNQAGGTCTQHRRSGTDYAWAMGEQKDHNPERETYKDMVGYLGRTGGELFGYVLGADFMGRVNGITTHVTRGHGVLPALKVACNADNLHKVTFDSAGGTFIPAQYTIGSNQIPKPYDPTRVGHKFNGWFVEGNRAWDFDVDEMTGDIILTAQWSVIDDSGSDDAGGGAGGGDGDGDGDDGGGGARRLPSRLRPSPNPTPAPGSILGHGGSGSGALDVPVTVDGNTGAFTIGLGDETREALIADAIANAEERGNGATPTITLDLSEAANAKSVILDMEMAKALAEAGVEVAIKLPDAEIRLNLDALGAIASTDAGTFTVEAAVVPMGDLRGMQAAQVKGYETVVSIEVFAGDTKIDVPLTVSLPYSLKGGENPNAVRVWHMADSGTLTSLNGVFDMTAGMITFSIGHQSYFVVGYDPVALWINVFSDVSAGAWYYESVAFANYHELFGGYGNGLFGPQDSMTRAMFVTVLHNLEGQPDINSEFGIRNSPTCRRVRGITTP